MILNNWFFEDDFPLAVAFQIKGSLYKSKSKYQMIEILDSDQGGKILLLDDKLMVTEKHEFYYHEPLTHPAMSIHPNPKMIMIIGGGDGGTVREVLKYKTVEEIELIEIDEEVINVSRKFFPETACELNNSKLKIKVNDAIKYVKSGKENSYDVIICDSTDPIGFASGLISKEFYKDIVKVLKPDGIYICQSGCPIIQEKEFKTTLENLMSIFKHMDLVTSVVPAYPGALWSFLLASNNKIDRKIKQKPNGKTKLWNEEFHEKLFAKPEWIKEKFFEMESIKL